ncbi:hyalin-like isoform X2 [Antedon mediterranea]|uniref:hyalin-like isoform X2 n=1 Tax=Antedon mediterranea TaxID=105859 RepID=UPI003AF95F3A
MFASVYTLVCFMTFLHISTSRIIQSCYDTFELVSEFKQARQSSMNANGVASYAVDGGLSGQYNRRTCSHTNIGKPEVVCPDDIEVNVDNNQTLHQVTWNPPEVSDNFHTDLSATCSPLSGSLFPIGFTQVTCSATDATGNERNCSFVVTIADNKEPDLVCPEPIIVNNSTDQYEDPVTWSDPTVTDNLHNDISATCSPESGSIFGVGSTIVTCSATDDTGNVGSCSFVVHVTGQKFISGDQRPFLTCPGHITVNSDQSRNPVTWTDPILTPGGISATCTPASESVFDDGSTIVTCSARDSNGDVIRCSFVVYVKEILKSDLTIGIGCPSDITFNTDQPVVVWNKPKLTDNVGTDVQPTCNPSSGSTFEVGSTRVTCYAVYPIVNISCWFNVGSIESSTPFTDRSDSGSTNSRSTNNASTDSESTDAQSWLIGGLVIIITLALIAAVTVLVVRYRKSKQSTLGINMETEKDSVTLGIVN